MKHLHAFVLLVCLLAAGCSSWERQSFHQLEEAQAALAAAQADYDARAIPQSACSRAVLGEGRAALAAAADAMHAYEANGKTAQQRTDAQAALDALVPKVARLQTLVAFPDSCGLAEQP